MQNKKCDICGKEPEQIIDGKTVMGGWANLCPDCHREYGCGLGVGKGQKYDNKTGELLEPKPKKHTDIESILEEAVMDGIIHCPECGNPIEPDCETCSCGWSNPMMGMGLI